MYLPKIAYIISKLGDVKTIFLPLICILFLNETVSIASLHSLQKTKESEGLFIPNGYFFISSIGLTSLNEEIALTAL